jgi:uncharacterized membrane protein YeaQ/YmgE (transglycosylase-associated protein family)
MGTLNLHNLYMRCAYDADISSCAAGSIIIKDMGIIAFLVLGGIAGWIASLIMGTDASQGIIGNVIVGIVGALIGGLVFNMFGSVGVTGFNVYSLIVATIGAILALWVVRMVRTA